MPALVAGIHVLTGIPIKGVMAGTSPAMTDHRPEASVTAR
jgi:hypothetical protein